MTSWRQTTSNQRWKNVAYINVEIYNIEKRGINFVYLNVGINNNLQTTLSFSMSSFTMLTNVEITLSIWPDVQIWKIKLDLSATKYFWASNKKHLKLKILNSMFQLLFQNLVHFIPHFNRNMKNNICKPAKVLETRESCITRTTL